MSGKLSERKIARLLAEREEHEPPAGLLERIRAEIPPLEALDLSPLRAGRARRGRLLHRLPTTWLAAASIVFACIGGFVFWRLTPSASSLPEEIGPGDTAPVSPNVPPPPPPPMQVQRGAEPEPGPGSDAEQGGSVQYQVAPRNGAPAEGLAGSAARQLQLRRRQEPRAAAPPATEEKRITTTAESPLRQNLQQERAPEADAKAKAPSGRVHVGGNAEGAQPRYFRPVPPPQRPPIPSGVVGGAPAPAVPSPSPPAKPQGSAGGAELSELEALPESAPADKPSSQSSTLFDARHPMPAQALREAFPPSRSGARRPPQCEGGFAPWARGANRFVLRIAAPIPASPPSGLAAEAPAARDDLERSKPDRRAMAENRLEKKEAERQGYLDVDAGPSVRFDPRSVVRVRRLGEAEWRKAGSWEVVAAAPGVEPLALFEIEARPGIRSDQVVAQVRTGGAVVREVHLAELKRPFVAASSELQLTSLAATLAQVEAGTLHLSPDELRALVAAARRAADRWPEDARSRSLRLRTEAVAPP
jgi:hypothetical protein